MPQWNLSKSFDYFGAQCANPRWSWSARSADGKVVVITLWADGLVKEGDNYIYHAEAKPDDNEWLQRPGNKERLENLIWAKKNCDGIFRVVITKAKNVKSSPREIEECFPHKSLVMQIVDLNEQTGEFRAISRAEAK